MPKAEIYIEDTASQAHSHLSEHSNFMVSFLLQVSPLLPPPQSLHLLGLWSFLRYVRPAVLPLLALRPGTYFLYP